MWTRDGLQPIEISQRKLYDLLTPRVGKKNAKAMAYSKRPTADWKKATLHECIGHSDKLVDIRILYLFSCKLTAKQEVILTNNKQKFARKREQTCPKQPPSQT